MPIFAAESIKISWTASQTEGVTEYNVYRSKSEKTKGDKIRTFVSGEVFYVYTDSGVSFNNKYYYRVVSVKNGVESASSSIVSATCEVPAPIEVKTTDFESSVSTRVKWTAPTLGLVLWYDVYRSTKESEYGSRIAKSIKGYEYLDTSVKDGQTYYYRVRSVTEKGAQSDYSSPVFSRPSAQVNDKKPTNVSAKSLERNGVQISWKKPEKVDVSSYIVYKSTSSSGPGDALAETVKTYYSEYELFPGASYFYAVKSVLPDGTYSELTDFVEARVISKTEIQIAPKVQNLKAEPTGKSGQIKLTWTNPDSKSFSFVKIFRSTESSSGGSIMADKVKGKYYTDSGLVDGVTYYYKVISVSSDGKEGETTTEVYVVPYVKSKNQQPPDGVLNLKVIDANKDGKSLRLEWRTPIPHLYSYIKIYRSEDPSDIGKTIVNRLRGTEYIDSSGITEAQGYYYTVKTINSYGLESTQNTTVRGISTMAIPNEGGLSDKDGDGLPDLWERENGYNPHLRDLGEIDDDKDGIGVLMEYEYGSSPWNQDSDNDGYSDGTEILNGYNPAGAGKAVRVKNVFETIKKGNFSYGKSRLSSFEEEVSLAIELKNSIEYEIGKFKIENKNHWYKLVNAYIYGGYSVKEIVHTLKKGPGLVHPSIPASSWRNSSEYKIKQNK